LRYDNDTMYNIQKATVTSYRYDNAQK